MISTRLPGRTSQIGRLRAHHEDLKRGLQFGRALSLIREGKLGEFLLQIEAFQLRLERLARRSPEEQRRRHLTGFYVHDECRGVLHPLESDAVAQERPD